MSTWYILKSQQKFGPYTYEEMIQMKQNNQLYDFDYVWKSGFLVWMPIAQVEELSSTRFIQWLQENPERKKILIPRKNPRTLYETPMMCHNNVTLWKGNTHSVSSQGALITMHNPFILPGNKVHIHFDSTKANELAFSVIGEIVGKKYSTHRMKYNTPLQYTVRFLNKDAGTDLQIKEWIQLKQKAA